MNRISLQDQLRGLESMTSVALGGSTVQLQPIPGEIEVIQVCIEQRDALPIYLTCSDSQILCMCYLWTEDEVRAERRTELLETLLDLNPSVPLSSFGRVGKHYVLLGALSRNARAEDVALDIAALSDNAVDALDAMSEFLV
jgi:uncharacterized protein